METKSAPFWWIKTPTKDSVKDAPEQLVPRLHLNSSTSLSELLEQDKSGDQDSDVDVGSILEEINRVAAESPLGPYEKSMEERSIDDIMKEAERIYLESSKSFEQLSQRSKTSHNISDLLSSHSGDSTPTPKSVSPLPMDPHDVDNDNSEYSADFSQESKSSKVESHQPSPAEEDTDHKKSFMNLDEIVKEVEIAREIESEKKASSSSLSRSNSKTQGSQKMKSVETSMKHLEMPSQMILKASEILTDNNANKPSINEKIVIKEVVRIDNEKIEKLNEEIEFRNSVIKTLEKDNKLLRNDINSMKIDLKNTLSLLEKTKADLCTKTLSSPEINLELEKALEDLKDSKEINTALQLQLDAINKTHQILKSSYDDLFGSNRNLERRVVELDSSLTKYKTELLNVQQAKDKLLENESNLNKLLEIEKLQTKSLKIQNEKDAKCIQDLNRQIREMERIIARKHPDSVSALIVAAKEDATDTNLTARKILEDRIKNLEQEVLNRDMQSSKVFLDIQEKFNQMKNKYESHIEDLELHVSDLKNQLKKKTDTYDVYTQTISDEKIPQKETYTVFTQTDIIHPKTKPSPAKKPDREVKEDAHLLATIRGLQADLSNKEKVVQKLQKDVDELRKTNRRLQKEREGSLRNLSEKKEFRSYPEKLSRAGSASSDCRKDEELQQLKGERDRLKQQLQRLEEDYQALKKKRLDDLTALQEAHEREVGTYVASVAPLREQLEVQQVSIAALQQQLGSAREELALAKAERDHLNARLLASARRQQPSDEAAAADGGLEVSALLAKMAALEKQYEEREYRLRAILHSLAQKSVTNRSCEQCADRQQQLIGYKLELDQLLATVRALN